MYWDDRAEFILVFWEESRGARKMMAERSPWRKAIERRS
jgi:hypothetical protein